MDESYGPDSPGDEEDARLVARILAMDREAEIELCRRFYSRVLYMLRHRTHGSRIADDLCQDTFEIILRKLRHEGLRDPRRLAAYVLNTAHFVFIGWVRREARHPNDGGGVLPFRTST